MSIYDFSEDLNFSPNKYELLDKFSSTITFKAAMHTDEARGFPPNVDPCSPGLMHNIISSFAKTADEGRTPPDNALPKIKISALTFS